VAHESATYIAWPVVGDHARPGTEKRLPFGSSSRRKLCQIRIVHTAQAQASIQVKEQKRMQMQVGKRRRAHVDVGVLKGGASDGAPGVGPHGVVACAALEGIELHDEATLDAAGGLLGSALFEHAVAAAQDDVDTDSEKDGEEEEDAGGEVPGLALEGAFRAQVPLQPALGGGLGLGRKGGRHAKRVGLGCGA